MPMQPPLHPASRLERLGRRAHASLLRLLAGAFLLGVMLLFMLATDQARADDAKLRFEGGIGEQDAARAGTALVVNDVFGVQPGGRPWVISALSATVSATDAITVDGRGLLLAGGAGIGGNGGQSVRATLLCNGSATTAPSTHVSGLVPLAPNGDFHIDDTLAPALPTPCGNAILLITNPGGAWFAAGIPKR